MNSSESDDKKKLRQQVAVALKDDPGSDSPQKITATGRGAVAEQIIQIALDSGVRVREDPDLAEILTVLDVDSTVPVEVLATISEILSYVYKTNAAMMPRKEFNDGPVKNQQ
ncbi:MAG: flagellar protein FhlB [Alphaproteobacteria bacterium]|jgi:flagellar biosynthesis protein|nr:flagellar protein FhlB [Alphaproteobacteria bacterium]MBT4084329.1 flagellar protein FhlB [Alphaproteobacteria bacterium]MBT4542771.1 flagellar protein FhlB [Alphaproteobacteria bacterium]MBT7743660.1 flagellar protein FhlB [Alphaproteobacteria bacterium]